MIEQGTVLAPQGDVTFTGVNSRLRAALLPPGWVADAKNCRFTDGTPRTRDGFFIMSFTNTGGGAAPTAVSGFQGIGVFKDPTDTRWIVFAANGATYYCRPGTMARAIALPAGVSISGETVEFVQCMDVLIMLRGTASAPLVLDDVTSTWRTISMLSNDPAFAPENPTDGTEDIPNAVWGLAMQNRLFLPDVSQGPDIMVASDFLNYTRYQPTLGAFRVNQGDDEGIVAAFPIPTPDDTPASAMAIFKERSIYIVSNIVGDLSALSLGDVTTEYSAACRRAIWRVGRDVWFVAAGRGVSSITQTTQNKWQGVDVPVSRDIQPLIDRINWDASAKIRAVKVGNLSYIAAPIDGATANNCIIVFDHLNGAWAGYDTGVAVQEFVTFNYEGVDRLFIWTTSGYCGLYEEGNKDDVSGTASASNSITTSLTTRGYAVQLGRQRAEKFTLQLRTFNPRYTITVQEEGHRETQALVSAKTKSRTAYYLPHMKAPWVNTNTNDDHGTAYRQDYSLDWTVSVSLGSNGIDLSAKQETTERYRVPRSSRGQAVQFVISNDRGSMDLHGVEVQSTQVDKRKGVFA